MSALDEMAVVVKCLRLGAADYLVKPLRTNELLNLWTHMWRRRRAVSGQENKEASLWYGISKIIVPRKSTNVPARVAWGLLHHGGLVVNLGVNLLSGRMRRWE